MVNMPRKKNIEKRTGDIGGSMKSAPVIQFRVQNDCKQPRDYRYYCAYESVRSPTPGVLPRERDILVVPSIPDVSTAVIAKLNGLMLAHRH
jgi:hypothetical protein